MVGFPKSGHIYQLSLPTNARAVLKICWLKLCNGKAHMQSAAKLLPFHVAIVQSTLVTT